MSAERVLEVIEREWRKPHRAYVAAEHAVSESIWGTMLGTSFKLRDRGEEGGDPGRAAWEDRRGELVDGAHDRVFTAAMAAIVREIALLALQFDEEHPEARKREAVLA